MNAANFTRPAREWLSVTSSRFHGLDGVFFWGSMAKRFTDTNKWKDSWYRNLKIKHKLVWFYLLDECDQAGVWKADFELLSFMIGDKIKEDEFCNVFGDRILKVAADKYLIKKFIYFQYGELTSKNTMYSKVLTCLKEVGIDSLDIPHRWE